MLFPMRSFTVLVVLAGAACVDEPTQAAPPLQVQLALKVNF